MTRLGKVRFISSVILAPFMVGLSSCSENSEKTVAASSQPAVENCSIELIVLGVGQDAGAPQIGYHKDVAWEDASQKLRATSLALVDYDNESRYLFEATPNISEQVKQLDDMTTIEGSPLDLSGIFITHAHMGHYAGLMFLGREAAGTRDIPVYAMPRLSNYLRTNGPWEQLVSLGNILLMEMVGQTPVVLSNTLSVTPYQVPHRDEYSETVGYKIETDNQSVLFIPDIDNWDKWEKDFGIKIEDMIGDVDLAYLDATFYSDQELPGRDMSKIPHPRVSGMMNRFDALAPSEKNKVHFIHMNHTNPIRFKDSKESQEVISRDYTVARRGDRHCLL